MYVQVILLVPPGYHVCTSSNISFPGYHVCTSYNISSPGVSCMYKL